MSYLLIALIAAGVSFLMARAVIAAGIWDAPDAVRKAHRAPIATSGGLAIQIGVHAAVCAAVWWGLRAWAEGLGPEELGEALGCIAAAAAAGILGAVDDGRPLPPRLKLAVLSAIALGFAAVAARAEAIVIAGPLALNLPWALAAAGSALFFFTLTNAVNFMDGANGLAIGGAAVTLTSLGALGLIHGAPHAAMLAFAAAGAAAGFLYWNVALGRLFAGDAGSLFIGALTAGVCLTLAQRAAVSPIVLAIAVFPFLFDVLSTLVWRARAGRALLHSHRDHLYQIALRAGVAHSRAAFVFWALCAHCGLAAIGASFAARIPAETFGPAPSGVGGDAWAGMQVLAWLAAAGPLIVLIGMTAIGLRVSARARAYAKRMGYDGA